MKVRDDQMSASPRCSICLDGFSGPASLPCGHCFCIGCIGEYWRVQELCQCPLCKTLFPVRPHLETSRTLRASVRLKAGEVSCDLCRGPAVKSCLECLASYCGEHLEPHYQSVELGRHHLLSVVKNLEDSRCRLHGKKLERFCRSDQTCVCTSCVQTDHRGHSVTSINKEAAKKKVKLKRQLHSLHQAIHERLMAVEKIRLCADIGGDDRKDEEVVGELEKEISELRKKNSELELLFQTEDDLRFLQAFLQTA